MGRQTEIVKKDGGLCCICASQKAKKRLKSFVSGLSSP